MATRDDVHRLVDELPEGALGDARAALRGLLDEASGPPRVVVYLPVKGDQRGTIGELPLVLRSGRTVTVVYDPEDPPASLAGLLDH